MYSWNETKILNSLQSDFKYPTDFGKSARFRQIWMQIWNLSYPYYLEETLQAVQLWLLWQSIEKSCCSWNPGYRAEVLLVPVDAHSSLRSFSSTVRHHFCQGSRVCLHFLYLNGLVVLVPINLCDSSCNLIDFLAGEWMLMKFKLCLWFVFMLAFPDSYAVEEW